MKKYLIATFLSILIFSIGSVNKVLAATVISNPLSVSDLPSLLCIIFDGLIFLGAPVLSLVILFAGLVWLTSMGDPAKISKAKNTITFAAIGLLVILSSNAIYAFIIDALGISATKCT